MYKYLTIIIWGLLAFSWLYPYHYAPWLVAENEFLILLIPCILGLSLIKNKKLKVNDFFIFILVLLYFSLIQYLLLDYYFLEDIVVISIYLIFILLNLIISKEYFNKKNANYFLMVIVFLSIINSIPMLFQYFNINNIFVLNHFGVRRFYGNIGQPNHLSTIFVMGIVSSILLYKRNIFDERILYITSLFLIFLIFLTGSRTGLLTLFFLLFLTLIFRNDQKTKLDLRFFGSLILIYFLLDYFFSENSRNSFREINKTISDSRLTLWEDSISSILANPWVGYGINGVRTSRLFGNLDFKVPYVSSHNILIDFFLWFGVIGGASFLIYVLLICRRIYLDERNSYEIFLFLTPFAVHCLLEYPFRYLYFLVLIIPVLSVVKGGKIFYIHRSVFIFIIFIYMLLISFVYIDFQRYSQSAFFAHIQKCEIKDGEPIVLDLMQKYSYLYCENLSQWEMRKVIYRYSYDIHIKYYLDLGYFDGNFSRFRYNLESDN